jgi:beta-glucosidase
MVMEMMHGRAVLTFLLLAVASAAYDGAGQQPVSRKDFPKGFVFGTASSSYQVSTSFLH